MHRPYYSAEIGYYQQMDGVYFYSPYTIIAAIVDMPYGRCLFFGEFEFVAAALRKARARKL